jgi:polysaccharide deacetylase 2 family uncharacterized protein YibQ
MKILKMPNEINISHLGFRNTLLQLKNQASRGFHSVIIVSGREKS